MNKCLKIVLICVGIAILLCIIYIIRNVVIINSLKDNEWISEYSFDEIDDDLFVEPDASEDQDDDSIPKESVLAPTKYLYRNSNYKRAEISKITIKNDGLEVQNVIEKWEMTRDQNGPIMAYITSGELIKEENNVRRFQLSNDKILYELTIVGNGKIRVLNCEKLFAFYNNCKAIEGLEYLDTSDVVTMKRMFQDCGATVLDLSQLDTSKVTDVDNMFDGAKIKTVYVRDEQAKELFQSSSNTINFEIKQ